MKIFGEEKLTFHRESQSGHSHSAYFLGKNIAVCFRMLVSSLHFTAFYLLLAAPMIPFRSQLGLGILYSYCKLACFQSASFFVFNIQYRYLWPWIRRISRHAARRWTNVVYATRSHRFSPKWMRSPAIDCARVASRMVLVLLASSKLCSFYSSSQDELTYRCCQTWFSEAFYQENTAPVAYLYNV